MPKCAFQVPIIISELENGTFTSQAFLLPALSAYSDSAKRSVRAIENQARSFFESISPGDINGISFPGSPEIHQVEVEVEPSRQSIAWERPVVLSFDVIRCVQAGVMASAYVPAFRIAVLAEKPGLLEKRVISHIRFALLRENRANLQELYCLQRVVRTEVDVRKVEFQMDSPKRQSQKKIHDEHKDKDETLAKVGTDLSTTTLSRAYGVDSLVRRLADALKGTGPGSVLLVGPSGVGKTAVVHQLVIDKTRHGLSARQFYSTSGSRLIAGMGGFGMWQEQCRTICKEASRCHAVLHVGGLMELMQVGKSLRQNIGIASFLRPYMLKGELDVIAECTADEIQIIEKEDPHLLQAFQRIDIEEPDQENAREILLNVALELSSRNREAITEDGIDLLDRLHQRYAGYSASPGRSVRFLTNLIRDYGLERTVQSSDVLSAFSRETGIPEIILDEKLPLDLNATKIWIQDRVMGHPEAVNQVVDLLAVIKSRLDRPGKPLASLLFAGPTGVGKTETAKVLAEFLFSDRQRLARFDMSEFSDPFGARRLMGGTADGEGVLTRKLREQPFTVVLLDEFEKAHPDTYDLLLQVLGEGRLTDSRGRVADFRNAVVIMTTNLGTESTGKVPMGISEQRDARFMSKQHYLWAVKNFLRPEMFNRIDAVIPFAPLDEQILHRIAGRELKLVAKRDGLLHRKVNLNISDEVAGFLVTRGFDPRYGARPIKRAAESELVTPLSCMLNSYPGDVLLDCSVQVRGQGLVFDVFVRDETRAARRPSDQSSGSLVAESSRVRRRMQKLQTAGPVVEVGNQIYRLELLEKRAKAKAWAKNLGREAFPEDLKRLPGLKALAAEIERLPQEASELEEQLLLSFYQGEELDIAASRKRLEDIRSQLDQLLLRLHEHSFSNPNRIIVAVYGESRSWMLRLAEAYLRIAGGISGCDLQARALEVGHNSARGKRVLVPKEIKDRDTFFANPPQNCIGVVLGIDASMAYPLFQDEDGLHVFFHKDEKYKCLVHVSEALLSDYVPPSGVESPGGIKKGPARRKYDCDKCSMTDAGQNQSTLCDPHNLHWSLGSLLQNNLQARARKLIEGSDCL